MGQDVVVADAGNMGIGATSPSYHLDVSGITRSTPRFCPATVQ